MTFIAGFDIQFSQLQTALLTFTPTGPCLQPLCISQFQLLPSPPPPRPTAWHLLALSIPAPLASFVLLYPRVFFLHFQNLYISSFLIKPAITVYSEIRSAYRGESAGESTFVLVIEWNEYRLRIWTTFSCDNTQSSWCYCKLFNDNWKCEAKGRGCARANLTARET